MNILVEDIAAACHEANRVLCRALGDQSQVKWARVPSWQFHSAIAGVEAALATRVALDRWPTAEEQHNAWMDHKRREGWTHGAQKDAEAKTHPCMLPFDQLPPELQAKDRLFFSIVRALAPLLPEGGLYTDPEEATS